MSQTASIAAPPTVSWPDDNGPAPLVAMACPNCDAPGPKPLTLTVHFATPDHPLRHSRLLSCVECGCRFYEHQTPPDYTDGAMLGRGRVAFYLQQGAGLSLITRPLARVVRDRGSVYLEVGCGFGFGVDFAIKAKGWIGTGIDPGQIAALGSQMLGVPIEQRYLGADEPRWRATCDVVMASETIEHVPSPAAFIATLRGVLRPGGVLILTTPDGEELHPRKTQGLLVPLLSPGLHLVFQTQYSLHTLLMKAGFSHIEIERDGTSLVAYASDLPLVLEHDGAVLRETYAAWLESRAATVARGGDLYFAFAGRALQEAVNDDDRGRAARVRRQIWQACRERFDFDADELDRLSSDIGHSNLEQLAGSMPLNLAGMLYADCIDRIATGTPRPDLSSRFVMAAELAEGLRRALGELAMEDGMSEAIAKACCAEALLCDAAAGKADVVSRLAASSVLALPERALIAVVNTAHYQLGRAIADAFDLWESDRELGGAASDLDRDVRFCLAVLDVQPDAAAKPHRAIRGFSAVLETIARPDTALAAAAAGGACQALELAWSHGAAARVLAWLQPIAARSDAPATFAALRDGVARRLFVEQVNAADYAAAHALGPMIERGLEAAGPAWTDGWRDAAFCLGVLHLQPQGEPARALALLAAVRVATRPAAGDSAVSTLFWAALRGEAQARERLEGAVSTARQMRVILADIATESMPEDLRAAYAMDQSQEV